MICDFAILGFYASIGTHDVIVHGDVDCQPGGAGGNRRTSCVSLFLCEWPQNVCTYSHADQPRSRNCTSKCVRKNTAHDVHVLWMQKFTFPSSHAHLISRPLSNVPTRHIRIHAVGNQRLPRDDSFLYAVHVTLHSGNSIIIFLDLFREAFRDE